MTHELPDVLKLCCCIPSSFGSVLTHSNAMATIAFLYCVPPLLSLANLTKQRERTWHDGQVVFILGLIEFGICGRWAPLNVGFSERGCR